jgi:hypothetical protein
MIFSVTYDERCGSVLGVKWRPNPSRYSERTPRNRGSVITDHPQSKCELPLDSRPSLGRELEATNREEAARNPNATCVCHVLRSDVNTTKTVFPFTCSRLAMSGPSNVMDLDASCWLAPLAATTAVSRLLSAKVRSPDGASSLQKITSLRGSTRTE